jgi:alkylation response protein AidB-like acyl-CoA dehydrogenase
VTRSNIKAAFPLTLIQAMHDAQLVRMYIPKSLEGLEVDPLTAMRVVEVIAAAEGAAGWTLMIGSTYGLFAALLPEPTAREIYAAPDAVVAGALRPTGRARATENGYVMSGRWSFASAIHHARWWNGGCILHDGDGPLRNAAGSPEIRLAFFRSTEGELVENWAVGELRGTGSHDYAVRELFVPESQPSGVALDPGEIG